MHAAEPGRGLWTAVAASHRFHSRAEAGTGDGFRHAPGKAAARAAAAHSPRPTGGGDSFRFGVTPSMATASMREPTLNERVLDKLAHITQLTAEIRQLVADQHPGELPAIESVLGPIEDRAHRLAKQLSQVPLGTVRH